jgi:hypothetical protein
MPLLLNKGTALKRAATMNGLLPHNPLKSLYIDEDLRLMGLLNPARLCAGARKTVNFLIEA